MRPTPRSVGTVSSLSAGLRAAAARPALVAMLWAWHLALGFALTIPVFRWLYGATALRPAADALADRFSFGWLAELLQGDSVPVLAMLQSGVAGGLLVAVLVSPLAIAVSLASLRDASRDAREAGAAAVALYWPFLRVIVFGRAAALIAGGVTTAALRLALRPLRDSPWEAGFLWAALIQAGGAVLVAVLLLATVDYALVRLEAERSRAGFRAWLAGLRFTLAHPALTLGLWGAAGLVFALLVGVLVALRDSTSFGVAALPAAVAIGLAFALQQVFMIARTWLRVGLLGAEQHVVDRVLQASSTWEASVALDLELATVGTPLAVDAGIRSDVTDARPVEEPREG